MLDRPVSGRVFFEQVIRDNLDMGRPDRVQLIFDRRVTAAATTPGRFRTRVITQQVTPSLYVDYKHTTIKQYHKEGRALRTETTINDTYDFAIGRRLTNLPALREIGFSANRRLLDVQRLSHDPADGTTALTAITDPSTPTPVNAWPACGSPTTGYKPCSRSCACSGSCHEGSPTGTSATTSNPCSGANRARSPADRAPTTSAAFATTDSSNASHTATATGSPPTATAGRSSSPEPTTGSSEMAWPNSPSPPRASQEGSAQPATPTTLPSTTYSLGQDSQPDPNLTHPERQTRPKPPSCSELSAASGPG